MAVAMEQISAASFMMSSTKLPLRGRHLTAANAFNRALDARVKTCFGDTHRYRRASATVLARATQGVRRRGPSARQGGAPPVAPSGRASAPRETRAAA